MKSSFGSETRKLLAAVVKDHGFLMRGSAHFRVCGDGIYQVIKIDKDRSLRSQRIKLALHSMYSALEPQWFTACHCIPKYTIIPRPLSKMHRLSSIEDIKTQIDILDAFLSNKLDHVATQAQLLEMMHEFENNEYGHVIWNDLQKFSPYLYVGNYGCARRVIESILAQHDMAYKTRSDGDSVYCLTASEIEEERKLKGLLRMATDENEREIREYLDLNYQKNMNMAKFCIRTGKEN